MQLAQGDSIEVVDYCKGSYVPNENNDEVKMWPEVGVLLTT